MPMAASATNAMATLTATGSFAWAERILAFWRTSEQG
jgi:hypothetical protein